MTTVPYGFRVVGHKAGERRLIEHAAALIAYAECDPRAEVEREAFLSHFVYPAEFRRHLERERSERGYTGVCGADWLYWDVAGRTTWSVPYATPGGLPGRSSTATENSMTTTCKSS